MISTYILLFLGGILGGFLNSTASSGSAIVLPLLVFLGVPATIANGTNRASILIGSLVSVWRFNHEAYIPWRKTFWIVIPTLFGSLLGSGLASRLSHEYIAWSILVAIVIAFFLLLSNRRAMLHEAYDGSLRIDWVTIIVFFIIGFWTGYIVLDSATWMLLALVRLVGFDLIEANGIKNLLLLVTSIFSVVIFQINHEINWSIAAALSLGSCFGAFVGSHIGSQKKYKIWIFRILAIAIIIEIVFLSVKIIYGRYL